MASLRDALAYPEPALRNVDESYPLTFSTTLHCGAGGLDKNVLLR